jgi:hypothetical protein
MNSVFKLVFLLVFILAVGSIGFYIYKTSMVPSQKAYAPCSQTATCPTVIPQTTPVEQVIDPSRPYIKAAKVNYTLVGTVVSVEKTAGGTLLHLKDDTGKPIAETLTIANDTEVLSVATKSASTQKTTSSSLTPGTKVQVIATGDLKSGNTSNLAVVSILVFAK